MLYAAERIFRTLDCADHFAGVKVPQKRAASHRDGLENIGLLTFLWCENAMTENSVRSCLQNNLRQSSTECKQRNQNKDFCFDSFDVKYSRHRNATFLLGRRSA